jgi:hypothetical protein
VFSQEITGIQTLQNNHAIILAQFPVKLSVTDINGKDLRSSAAEQNIGKTSGGRTDVQSNCTGHINIKARKGMVQLYAATGDPGMIFAADFEL